MAKKYLWIFIIGGAIGSALMSWFGPPLITWWYNPPAEFGISCTPTVEWAMSKLKNFQLLGLILGGGLGMVIYFAVSGKKKKTEPTLNP